MIDRSCGSCSMCCKFFYIPEVNKLPNKWCQFCKPGKNACTIYADRPKVCKDFECLWKYDAGLGDEWFPARCKMVLVGYDDISTIMVKVDPSFPNAWRREPYHSQLLRWSGRYDIHITVGRNNFHLCKGIEIYIPYDFEKEKQAMDQQFAETGCSGL
jgi:hypothetical protein